MPTIDDFFQSRVEEILANSETNKIYFFKGFGIKQIEYLIGHPNSLLKDDELICDGVLDIAAIDKKWMNIALAISSAKTPLVGFYEELLVIRDDLRRIQNNGIVIIENNMLSPWVPCCISHQQALDLFDYHQNDLQASESLKILTELYGEVRLLDHEKALLLPLHIEDTSVTREDFWSTTFSCAEIDDYERIELDADREWEYCLDILQGVREQALFLVKNNSISQRHRSLFSALSNLGISFCVDELELYEEKFEYTDNQFVPLLRKYWGENASFRPLMFYKDPDASREIIELSQGQIIAEIVDQCERAADEDEYRNIFITAPTGAGKSILFQLPALYLAEKYKFVTIVVSPLIALMNDQVEQLVNRRGVSIAACVNSSMSVEERTETMAQIRSGQKSLLYLAPELLMTINLKSFLGGRTVGLFVVDEAHTVTSWGQDFRSDYWFLGDFLKQTKRNGMAFPVLCLTATAVYSGEEDVVKDTIQELGLGRAIIHLGRVKRENISFEICRRIGSELKKQGEREQEKRDLILARMRTYIAKGEKVLAYFPYATQVEYTHDELVGAEEKTRIRRYHAKLTTAERKLTETDYKSGEALGLFCTKAFGMGVDVDDIKHVIHFAPTGTLADYVQEIGRAARDPKLRGTAHIDYFDSDLRYVRTLNGMSEMRQFQLREMLKKISTIYNAKKRRNLLISAETFEYLFPDEKNIANRTKQGLKLLAKDLSNKYPFPVLIVRPRAMLSQHYVNVPSEVESAFLEKYGAWAKVQYGSSPRRIVSGNAWASDTIITNTGKTYLLDMAGIWESCFPDRSFGSFKRQFFETEIDASKPKLHLAPRVRVVVRYSDDYRVVEMKLKKTIEAIVSIFDKHKNADIKKFTRSQFENELLETLGEKIIAHDKAGLLLGVFTKTADDDAAYTQARNITRVLTKQKQPGGEDIYFVSNDSYSWLDKFFSRNLSQCWPEKDNYYHQFYPLCQDKSIEIMPLLRVLELLDLASYEIRGGEKAEIFVRINDPDKIKHLAAGNHYNNGILKRIHERHENSCRLLNAFFKAEMSDDQRWDLIEQYFLGNEQFVNGVLGLGS